MKHWFKLFERNKCHWPLRNLPLLQWQHHRIAINSWCILQLVSAHYLFLFCAILFDRFLQWQKRTPESKQTLSFSIFRRTKTGMKAITVWILMRRRCHTKRKRNKRKDYLNSFWCTFSADCEHGEARLGYSASLLLWKNNHKETIKFQNESSRDRKEIEHDAFLLLYLASIKWVGRRRDDDGRTAHAYQASWATASGRTESENKSESGIYEVCRQ